MQKSILFSITEALLGASLCPPSEFQTFPRRNFGRFACRCRNFVQSRHHNYHYHHHHHQKLYLFTASNSYKNMLFHRAVCDLSPGQADSQVDANWKLESTCDSVWPGFACTCVDLRWLTLTLVEIKFAPFGRPTQVNASWVTSINLLLVNEIEDSLP